MAQLLVRELDDAVMARLKERARRNRHSLQAEVRAILEAGAQRHTKEAALEMFRVWHAKIGRRSISDSIDLIRADRDR